MSLLVVGSVAYDSISTPHGGVKEALGGSAVYFSLAARLFVPVRLVGVVGGDFDEEHVEFLRQRRVDVAGLERVPDGRTFRWSGEYSPDMNQRTTLSVEVNVFDNYQPKIPEAFRDSRFVFLANGSPVTQMSVLDQMAKPSFVMADTMDLWIQTQLKDLSRLLERIDGLLINDSEAALLTGSQNILQAGRLVQKMGPATVIVKKGEHGAVLFDGDEILPLPGYPVPEVRDPTGAGDSFAGAFMGYLASAAGQKGSDGAGQKGSSHAGPKGSIAAGGKARMPTRLLKEALAYGTVAASFTVEDFGVRSIARATESDVRRRFEKYRELLSL